MSITLNGGVAEIVKNQVSIGNYKSAEDLIYDALEALVIYKTEQGINEGISDIESGHYIELKHNNIKEILSKPISQW